MTEIQHSNSKFMFIQIFNRFISLFINNMYANTSKIHYKTDDTNFNIQHFRNCVFVWEIFFLQHDVANDRRDGGFIRSMKKSANRISLKVEQKL